MASCIICGANGRMGRTLVRAVCASSAWRCAACVDPAFAAAQGTGSAPRFSALSLLPDAGVRADVVIDFSCAQALAALAQYCLQTSTPCVLCATGYSPAQQRQIEALAHCVPVFQSANLSYGAAVLTRLVREATRLLDGGYDVAVTEAHHRGKKDAPSGTAKTLIRAIGRSDVPVCAVRAGTIIGEHQVLFAGQDETLTLAHHAQSRAIFAQGALRAAQFVKDQEPGIYHMEDLVS